MSTPTSREISRRRLAIGAAWSVPVIAVVAASPAYAASGALSSPDVTWAKRASDCRTLISWLQVDGATSYEFQYRTNNGNAWTTPSTSPTTGVQADVPANARGVRVRAVNATGESEWAVVTGITNNPPAPSGITATRSTSTGATTVTWAAVPGAVGYQVQYRLGTSSQNQTRSGVAASVTSETFSVGDTTSVRVRTLQCEGDESGWSERLQVTVTT